MKLEGLKKYEGITVAQLKKLVVNWPEIDAWGEPTEVWIETGRGLSGPCKEIVPLNYRIREDKTPTSDLLFCPDPAAFSK